MFLDFLFRSDLFDFDKIFEDKIELTGSDIFLSDEKNVEDGFNIKCWV